MEADVTRNGDVSRNGDDSDYSFVDKGLVECYSLLLHAMEKASPEKVLFEPFYGCQYTVEMFLALFGKALNLVTNANAVKRDRRNLDKIIEDGVKKEEKKWEARRMAIEELMGKADVFAPFGGRRGDTLAFLDRMIEWNAVLCEREERSRIREECERSRNSLVPSGVDVRGTYTREQCADLLQVSPGTVDNLRKRGKLKMTEKVGKCVRITGESLNAYFIEKKRE